MSARLVNAESEGPRRRTLIAGVSEYESQSISNLTAVEADIRNISDALKRCDVTIEKTLINPRRNDFFREALQFCSTAKSNDYLFIYFSGHGLSFNDVDYLVFHDAYLEDPRHIEQFLVDVNLYGALAQSEAKEIVFLIDACREGLQLTSKAISIGQFKLKAKKAPRANVHTVFSCRANEYSRTVNGNVGSLFTYSLCEALNAREYGAGSLDNILIATEEMMRQVATAHNIESIQQIYLLEEKRPIGIPARFNLFPPGIHVLRDTREDGDFCAHPGSDFLWPSFTQIEQYWRQGHFGEGVTVYAISESFLRQHLELREANVSAVDYLRRADDVGETLDLSKSQYGTALASIICGKNIGIAPKCKYVSLLAIIDGATSNVEVLEAILYLLEEVQNSDGRYVFLIPVGFEIYDPAIEDLLLAVSDLSNAVVVAPAGNRPEFGILYPAAHEFVLSVGAVSKVGEVESFSEFGEAKPDVYGISSVMCADSSGLFSYSPGNGTSHAAAYVAGLIALLWSAHPSLSSDELRNHLTHMGIYPKNKLDGPKILIAGKLA
ncbi:subtilisin family serine protease [Bradyrhizobium sp. GM7.3]